MISRPTLIGFPYDASSSYLRGASQGPAAIRAALQSPAMGHWSERVVKTICGETLDELGDIALPDGPGARECIERVVAGLAREQRPFIALGGDHSMTYAILRGLKASYGPLTVLQIDAHPCLNDHVDGDRFSHFSSSARIMEEGLARRLVQVGLRAITGHQRDQARRFDVEQIDMRAWADGARPSTSGQVYVSIDLDAFDPAFAPGVAHREPGGLTAREVITLLDTLGGDMVGAEIVEFNPSQDIGGLTAVLAAKLVKELAAQFVVESD